MLKTQLISDRLAILFSSLCVTHCLATPLLLITVPSLAGSAMLEGEAFHQFLLLIVVPVGLFALILGYSHHKQKWVVTSGILGMLILGIPVFLETTFAHEQGLSHQLLGNSGEVYLTVLASSIIVATHFINYRFRRQQTATAFA